MKQRIDAVVKTARAWREPAYGPRVRAVAATRAADNRFTEEALAFAINERMAKLRPAALQAWADPPEAAPPRTVGVLVPGRVPLDGLRDVLAVLLSGHHALVHLPNASAHLLPAFIEEASTHAPGLPIRFVPFDELVAEADALLAAPADAEAHDAIAAACERHGLPPERFFLRPPRFGVAVLDGKETEEEREDLAEDMLLHEGEAERSVRLCFAPRALAPDALLDAFALFRGVFPAHPKTEGVLAMQKAFLAAAETPHAYGEGLEFLLSKGPAEVQRPGHLRWVAYDDLDEVAIWLTAHLADVSHVAARARVARRLKEKEVAVPVAPPGTAHRPPLDALPDPIAFLKAL